MMKWQCVTGEMRITARGAHCIDSRSPGQEVRNKILAFFYLYFKVGVAYIEESL